jgi:hypothetical protein
VAVAILIRAPMQWPIALALVFIGSVYLYRMHRFGVYYAREVYNQFLLLPDQTPEVIVPSQEVGERS